MNIRPIPSSPLFSSESAFPFRLVRRLSLRPARWLLAGLAGVPAASAVTTTWSGAGANDNWSTLANWDTGAAPSTSDAVVFSAADVTALGTVNNIVASSLTVAGLKYSQLTADATTGHTTQISAGAILTLTGNLQASNSTNIASPGPYVTAAIIKGDGKLVITSATTRQLLVTNGGSQSVFASLDLSGLAEFEMQGGSASSVVVGSGTNARASLSLAKVSSVKAATITVGQGNSSADNTGGPSQILLGQTTTLNSNTITIGSSRNSGELKFQGGLSGTPTVTIRDLAGTGKAALLIGDMKDNRAQSVSGLVDFSGGTVDGLFSTITVGSGYIGNGSVQTASTTSATLRTGAGTITADAIVVGATPANTQPAGARNVPAGVLDLTGAGTVITGSLTLADDYDTLGTNKPTATVNLAAGTLRVGTAIAKGAGGGTATFNFNGGLLQAGGSSATFMTGLTAANVKAGGARIDTNGFNITIGQLLAHDSGLGLTVDGGLRKSGAGTLTLSAANTYTGATQVYAGVLATGATGAFGTGGIEVAGGAGLSLGNAASIADTATVRFFSDSTISLGFDGTETIGSLHLLSGSQSIVAGIYSAAALNTYFNVSTFAGDGLLSVQIGAPIPEPGVWALIAGTAALPLAAWQRRRAGAFKGGRS